MSEDNGRGPANARTDEMAPHYKKEDAQQHWDRMWDLYREAWFVGNITKYVERYRSKNGLKDLEKARHYLDKLIELETAELARIKETGNGPATEDHVPSPLGTGIPTGPRPVPSVSLPPRWEGNSGPETDES